MFLKAPVAQAWMAETHLARWLRVANSSLVARFGLPDQVEHPGGLLGALVRDFVPVFRWTDTNKRVKPYIYIYIYIYICIYERILFIRGYAGQRSKNSSFGERASKFL